MPNLKDDFKALEIIALKSREKPDMAAEVRKLCRWFSKNYHVPLPEVEKMDLHYLLLHKYEDFINNLNDDDYLKYKNTILYPDKLEQIAAEDDDWLAKELAEEEKKLKEAKTEPDKLNLPEGFDVEFD